MGPDGGRGQLPASPGPYHFPGAKHGSSHRPARSTRNWLLHEKPDIILEFAVADRVPGLCMNRRVFRPNQVCRRVETRIRFRQNGSRHQLILDQRFAVLLRSWTRSPISILSCSTKEVLIRSPNLLQISDDSGCLPSKKIDPIDVLDGGVSCSRKIPLARVLPVTVLPPSDPVIRKNE